ncbi:g2/mitotic-specific cyclin cdc13 [Ephemerocybe angulata]|uniref:G2/mitotic-specific cyclin cdc13 n=1 Tax=Ephemerocybe angulata TaxID=980116 RepID=A0A8H6I2K0_9AGAR|nr:g2/mitotic-specific cyclin cdc13 [Tulosesus angulatus]
MASNIPTRRVLRPSRAIVSVKENENANAARTSRLATRGKALASGPTSTAAPSGTTGTTAGMRRTTFASRAKTLDTGATSSKTAADAGDKQPAVKRKREAFGEVAGGNKAPKEKESSAKEFDGVVLKAKPVSSRQPFRTVASKQIGKPKEGSVEAGASKVKPEKDVKEAAVVAKPVVKSRDENAMHIDHVAAPAPAAADPMPSLTVPPVIAPKRTEGATRVHRTRREIEQDEEEEHRVFKKRRTSSDAPEPEPQAEEVEEEDPEAALHARLEAEMEAFANEPEVDPEHSGWDDLDAEDGDDPLMVSEYVVEIFQYMRQLEISTMPNPNYMESQKELAWKMRGILTDWLVQVHVRFRLLPETLFLCVNIIDRFLSARVVSLAKLQLVGITCLFIAAKTEEIVAPGVGHFLSVADSSYTDATVLKTLDWNLSYPNPVHFLRRVSKADDYNVTVRTLGKYLLEIGCLEWRLIAAPPSLMAAAAIWLARLASGFEDWTANLAHYSGYKESALIPTANLMLNYILKPIRHEAFRKKYAGKKFQKASVYMREWALQRWPGDHHVDLSRELPRIKALIKLHRDMAEQGYEHEENADGEEETFAR